MTRTEHPPNVVGVTFWTCGTIAALVAVLLWKHPEAWPWIVAVWAVCGLLGLGIVAVEARAENGVLRRELERREREDAADWRDPYIRSMEAEVVAFDPGPPTLAERPDLRIVGPDALPVADESWLDEVTRDGGWLS